MDSAALHAPQAPLERTARYRAVRPTTRNGPPVALSVQRTRRR